MERPITRSLLATFIEYATKESVTVFEWQRFVVRHYEDEEMEAARRECVRILAGADASKVPTSDLQLLYAIADNLRAIERRQ
jgi:hypothetical protein